MTGSRVADRSLRPEIDGRLPQAPEYLRERLDPGANDEIIVCPDANLLPHLAEVEVVIPKMQRIGAEAIEAGTFRLVQQWGAGLEGVDVEAAKRKGVFVANVPATGGNAESVANTRCCSSFRCYATCQRRRLM